MSFVELLRQSSEAGGLGKKPMWSGHPLPDRWPIIVEKLQGRPTAAGGEWIAARDVFEELGIPHGAYPRFSRCVAGLMKSAGWAPSLVGPRHSRCRGYIKFMDDAPT